MRRKQYIRCRETRSMPAGGYGPWIMLPRSNTLNVINHMTTSKPDRTIEVKRVNGTVIARYVGEKK